MSKGIQHLQDRINATKQECTEMEEQLSDRVDYLQDNFTGMATTGILQSILSVPKSLVVKKDLLGNMLKAHSIKDFLKKMFLDVLKTISMRFGLNLVREFAEKQNAKNDPEAKTQEQQEPNIVNETKV